MKKLMHLIVFMFLFLISPLFSQESSGSVKYDGEIYETTIIGNQKWLKRNLNYKPKIGKFWCYDNKANNCANYGRLYDWATAMNLPPKCNDISSVDDSDCKVNSPHQGICPEGYYIPSKTDWDSLINYIGGRDSGYKLRAKNGWKRNYNSADKFGFAALPSGTYKRIFNNNDIFNKNVNYEFHGISEEGLWLVANELGKQATYARNILYNSDMIGDRMISKAEGVSIRCLQAYANENLVLMDSTSSDSYQITDVPCKKLKEDGWCYIEPKLSKDKDSWSLGYWLNNSRKECSNKAPMFYEKYNGIIGDGKLCSDLQKLSMPSQGIQTSGFSGQATISKPNILKNSELENECLCKK